MTGNKILFQPAGKEFYVEEGQSVLDVALKHGIEISHSCGAMGSCTTCRVIVEKSSRSLPPRNELEQDLAEMRGFKEIERLACQLPASGVLVVRVPSADKVSST